MSKRKLVQKFNFQTGRDEGIDDILQTVGPLKGWIDHFGCPVGIGAIRLIFCRHRRIEVGMAHLQLLSVTFVFENMDYRMAFDDLENTSGFEKMGDDLSPFLDIW